MKKLIILLVLLTSCASRKVSIDKIEIKKDSVVETKAVVATLETHNVIDSTNIVTEVNTDEVCIEPLDATKEMVVDGKSYINVVLRLKKNKVNTLYTNNKNKSDIRSKDSIGTSKTSTKENTSGKTKVIDKKANYWFILYWLILIIILYLLYKNRKKILMLA